MVVDLCNFTCDFKIPKVVRPGYSQFWKKRWHHHWQQKRTLLRIADEDRILNTSHSLYSYAEYGTLIVAAYIDLKF